MVVFPLEYLVEVFTNPLKGLMAHELAERGYSQSRIGQILGVSQPAVSTYIKTKREVYEEKLLRVVDRRQLQSLIRSALALVETSTVEMLRYVDSYALALLTSLKLCPLHKSQYGELQSCEICREIATTRTAKILDMALEVLKKCKNCHKLVPKVLMNIVQLGPEGAVGFPGRIYVEGTELIARESPKPGASRFLARLLEEVNKKHPQVLAVANAAYVALDCASRKLTVARVGPSDSEEEIVKNVSMAFSREMYDVVYDSGGRGIEPNAYVFGVDAIDVATKMLEIAKCIENF